MKLLRLTIHNIASIGDAEVDFENGPLAEDSRFLICGPTGAGKTTLLDAICLALYGTTPRLNGARSEDYVDSSENYSISGGRENIKINDTRMLMRRGSLNAFVELLFLDKDGRKLKAEWKCSRAYNRADGAIKVPEWMLWDAENEVLISAKKTEVQTLIESCVGMTFEQFCRTTMLAQGEFTRFLKSEENKKSEILEKLTGTGVFSEIGAKIYRNKTDKEIEYKEKKSLLDGVQLLTESQVKEIELKQQNLAKNIQLLTQEENRWKKKLDWIDRDADVRKQCMAARSAYESIGKQMASEEFQADKKMLVDWEQTAVQRDAWKKRQQTRQLLVEKQAEENELKHCFLKLWAGLVCEQQNMKEVEQRKVRVTDYLAQEAPKTDSYKQLALVESLAAQRVEALAQQKKVAVAIVEKDRQIMALQEQSANIQKQKDQLSEALVKAQQELETAQAKLDSMGYEALLEKQNRLSAQQKQMNEYAVLAQDFVRYHEAAQEKRRIWEDVQLLVADLTVAVTASDKEEKELEQRVREQETVLEKQKLACSDLIQEYRRELQEGEVCPLCGQKIEHLASDEHFVSVLQPQQALFDDLRRQLQEVGKKAADNRARLATGQRDVTVKQREYLQAQTLEQDCLAKKEKHQADAYFKGAVHPEEEISKASGRITDALQQVDKALKEIGVQQVLVRNLQQTKDGTEVRLRHSENECKRLEMQLSVLRESRTADLSLQVTTEQQLGKLTEQLKQWIDMDALTQYGQAYLDDFRKRAGYYQKANDKLQQLDTELLRLSAELSSMDGIKSRIVKMQSEWGTLQCPEGVQVSDVASRWADLQSRVARFVESRCSAQKQLDETGQLLEMYFGSVGAVPKEQLEVLAALTPADIERKRTALQAVQEEQVRLHARLETLEKEQTVLQEAKPEMEDDLTREIAEKALLLKRQEVVNASQEMGGLVQTLQQDGQNRLRFESIRRELDLKVAELDRWSRLSELFGSAKGDKFRNIAQSYVLEQLLVNANQYLRQFTDRYEMVCQPGSLTILLRDLEVGGVIRPSSTVSGGESFLISLSLALGLSSLSRSSFSMDTLFIDEGFGTLDSSFLSAVMDALERLHQIGGKRIGIISHVESLKERLTTQIRVSRVNTTLSRVDVVSLL